MNKEEEIIQYRLILENSIGFLNPLIVKAIRKQIPIKPNIKDWSPALCPCCETELSEHQGDSIYHHYYHLDMCNKCGQRLDWKGIE